MRRWLFLSLMVFPLALAALASSLLAEEPKVDESPMPVKVVRAFPELRLNRPIVLTHDGVDPKSIYIASQLGKIHRLPNNQRATENDLELFLDWEEHVVYKDKENEEGLLGFVFHPNYKENGEFFLHYTSADHAPQTSVIARFKAKGGKADPASHEQLMVIEQPFWNHNGGQLQFGPDGYLYIALGDGGKANDPLGHGQNLATWLGSILRIDVDRKDEGKAYAIPKDNPFVNVKDAQPEIYAYGLRNVWGMHFDPKTDLLWAADVGQDLWEEINIIEKGGNYGWNLREGFHEFPPGRESNEKGLLDPIWEYHHEIGKSITGGMVYRGKQVPELQGWYVYADYVSGRVWALKYDAEAGRVVANRPIATGPPMPYISFGTDADGEVFITDAFGQIWQFAAAK
jgi:glucose/arabinose dehydrogenase